MSQPEASLTFDNHDIRLTTFKSWRKEMGLLRTRQQAHTTESIRDAMTRLRQRFPNAGEKDTRSILFHEEKMSVSR